MKQRGPASVREPGVQANDSAASKPADRMLRTSYRLGTAEAKPEGTLNRLNGVKDIKASYPDETVRPASFLSRHRRINARLFRLEKARFSLALLRKNRRALRCGARRIQLDSLPFVW